MGVLAIRQVSVWVDEVAPEQGAFAHALEWASRLVLPLRGVVPWAGSETKADSLKACVRACKRSGVAWTAWTRPENLFSGSVPRPGELFAFGEARARRGTDPLVRHALRAAETPVLVCAPAWRPLPRVLILNPDAVSGSRFLDEAARLCAAMQTAPIVLTVAASAAKAARHARSAEKTFAAHRLVAAFDVAIGCPAEAAERVARWRRCSQVFVPKRTAPFWWRWFRSDPLDRLLGLTDTLTVLALPVGVRPDGATQAASEQRSSR